MSSSRRRTCNAPAVQKAIARLERRAVASGRAFEPITVDVNKHGTVANITLPIAGNGTDAASNAAFHVLRETIVPETVGAVPNTEAGVTGRTAAWRDAADELKSNLLPVVAFVLLFAFMLMLVAFRSIVIALKAILLNLLSVAAAYGVLVLVFQHGVGKGLLGVSSADGIEAVVPLLLFVILFGLSMDYHVFIISRIRETFDRGARWTTRSRTGSSPPPASSPAPRSSWSACSRSSARFRRRSSSSSASGSRSRSCSTRRSSARVLLPATMKLLGDSNWYLPKWLEWLPRARAARARARTRAEPAAGRPSAAEAEAARVHSRADRRPPASIGLVVLGLAYLGFGPSDEAVSVPAGREGRPADPEAVQLRHREGQLRRGLRHARRAREPARPAARG